MSNPTDQQSTHLEQRTREAFDDQVASLDAHTLSRLNRARQAALEVARQDRLTLPRWLIPAGSAAALALAAVMMVRIGIVDSSKSSSFDSNAEAIEIIASNDDLELYQDMDFYDSLEAIDTTDSEVT